MLTLGQRNSLEEATSLYQAHLPGVALDYMQGRGISEATCRMYRLGYVAPGHALLGDEQYTGRLSIPFISAGGVVGMRFRAVTGEEPKYLSRQGDEGTMFSVTSLLDQTNTIVITEGEIDCMTLNQMHVSAVGISGAKNFKRHFRLLLQDFDRVLVACDGDQAGRDFGKHIADQVQGAIPVSMPDGHDVNSVFTTMGEDKLRELLRLV